MVTHCAAANIQYRVRSSYSNDRLTRFLFDVEQRLDYRMWFFGHYHENLLVAHNQLALYGDIWEIVLGDARKKTSCDVCGRGRAAYRR